MVEAAHRRHFGAVVGDFGGSNYFTKGLKNSLYRFGRRQALF
jgi:hypothetical protein